MPENSKSYSHGLLKIYSLFGAVYLTRTGGVTEMGKKQPFKKLLSFLEQSRKYLQVRYLPSSRAWLDH